MKPIDKYMEVYATELARAHAAKPKEYLWPVEQMPVVLGRMRVAIERGSFNKNGAHKPTCKNLGIKYTYTAIREFLNT